MLASAPGAAPPPTLSWSPWKFRSASPLAFFYLFNVLADQVKQEKIPNLKRWSKEEGKDNRRPEGYKSCHICSVLQVMSDMDG